MLNDDSEDDLAGVWPKCLETIEHMIWKVFYPVEKISISQVILLELKIKTF